MSNARKTRWTAAQITAANAEQALAELAGTVASEPNPVARMMLAKIWDLLDEEGRADELPGLLEGFQAEAARKTLTSRLAAELKADGCEPGVIAAMERAVMELGDDYWAGLYRKAARDG